jgi:hypothetical protein
MTGSLAASAAGASLLDDLPEWFLDPPKGRSMVVVPRAVRLVLPERKFISTEAAVRYAIERRLSLRDVGIFSDPELVRIEKKGEREVRQERIDGVWRAVPK